MGLIIGVDGGGSGCRVAVADAAGTVLARAEGGPANIATDPEGALRSILACAETAFHQAAGSSARMGEVRAGLGLAGANAAGAAERLTAALPFARCRVETDAMTAARGALGAEDGILAAIGTGSVFVRQQGGQLRQFGGWGIVLGDEGSGASLGRAALRRALRAAEGFVPMTGYLSALIARFGGAEGVIAFSLSARPSEFAQLAPEITASDDPACRAIWAENVSDIAGMLTSLGAPALPVTFAGGLAAACAAALPDIPQRPAKGTSLDGALMLARGL
ncbi:ATPase [Rhodobacter sp. SGA-6-6]|uniref:BadF/BadG/BcrA/BcrD ATPase family protein n=1 Tax=Rhodobacter sp. SGA-6-6 TaxID=2710882 RepID=UPI0013EA7927|nr:BadF/BadG/BcrA/BcrD ATPase family protein [Rhodobacter sp. SGA-6-6]NGM44424.1 ATPase [Rhodobacter sp. SGA-6-6]